MKIGKDQVLYHLHFRNLKSECIDTLVSFIGNICLLFYCLRYVFQILCLFWTSSLNDTRTLNILWLQTCYQEAMSTDWNTKFSISTWRNSGTGCPGRLYSLHYWRYWKDIWMWSWATCFKWPCLSDPQRSLPSTTVLWFCCRICIKHCQISFKKNFNCLKIKVINALILITK